MSKGKSMLPKPLVRLIRGLVEKQENRITKQNQVLDDGACRCDLCFFSYRGQCRRFPPACGNHDQPLRWPIVKDFWFCGEFKKAEYVK